VTSSAPASSARFLEFWKEAADLLEGCGDTPLSSRIAGAAVGLSGARRAMVFLREKEVWVRAASAGEGEEEELELPDPSPRSALYDRGALWVPLETEGEVHGFLGLSGLAEEECSDLARSLGLLFGGLLGANRLSRLVKEAEFEVKTRLLELESLYDLGLSLAGQLDLPLLADEVLFRSISLTDARRGSLVLFDENGSILLERSLGESVFPLEGISSWKLPGGEAVINNEAASVPTSGLSFSACQKRLAVAISVAGRRRGVLAVAAKESRDGGILDFTPADARPPDARRGREAAHPPG
jgi:hypothetical protein